MTDISHIRNFCIVAHIDHGKSTLADRLLELTHTVEGRDMRAQYLDKMDLERERGITIKAQAVRLLHDGFELNLIDTPGHVDFTYEVSRSLEACEGAVLLVDAAQGIEAQTLANFHLARDAGLVIVPALNKIDLPAAEPDQRAKELADLLDRDPDDILRISAKSGAGVKELLAAIVDQVPPPVGDADAPLRALIFDSMFDPYRGVITYIRVKDGSLPSRERIRLMATRVESEAEEAGVMAPEATPVDVLGPGEVGYLVTGLQGRAPGQGRRHDHARRQTRCDRTAPGLPRAQAHGLVGAVPGRGRRLRRAAGGAGPPEALRRRPAVRARDIDGARLRVPLRVPGFAPHGHREGAPGARVRPGADRDGAERGVPRDPRRRGGGRAQPGGDAGPGHVRLVEEPIVFATIITPADFVGTVLDICESRRGEQVDMSFLTPERAEIHYVLPLAEIVFDFFDALKSRTRGYASLDYEPWGYQEADLVRVDVLLHGEPIDAFSVGGPSREGARRTAGRWWSGCAS